MQNQGPPRLLQENEAGKSEIASGNPMGKLRMIESTLGA